MSVFDILFWVALLAVAASLPFALFLSTDDEEGLK